MSRIDNAASELREMDELAVMSSPAHSLHPLAKLTVTITYILATVSFGRYDLSGLAVMALYPALMFSLSGIPVTLCFRKLRYMLPLVCAVGLFNPFFDREIMMRIGGMAISGGVISMLTLMMKGVFCLTASFLLAATTTIDAVCAALRRVRGPNMLVTLVLLTYRYISLMVEEVSIMSTAYSLRAPGQKGIHFSAWGSFLGQLLLRGMDRAEELYDAMRLRGFHGEFYYADVGPIKTGDCIFTAAAVAAFVLCRSCNIAELIGGVALGGAL